MQYIEARMSSFLTITLGHSEGTTRQREVTNDRLVHQKFALSVHVLLGQKENKDECHTNIRNSRWSADK
jgi:hypothetical protein